MMGWLFCISIKKGWKTKLSVGFFGAQALLWLFGAAMALADLPISFDLGASSAGYDHTGVNPGDSTPTIGEFSLGLAAKYHLLDWFAAGIQSTYESFNQYSDPTAAVGNRTGWRWSAIEPMIEVHNNFISVKLSYSFMGNYHLSNATFAGFNDLVYENPKGEKLAVLIKPFDGYSFWTGLYYSQVRYDWANFTTGPLPLQTWQLGLTLELRLLENSTRSY